MTAMVLHQSYMTQRHSLFTLISCYAIVFSFTPMFTDIGLYLLRDGSLYCFCLLAESYETINQPKQYLAARHSK